MAQRRCQGRDRWRAAGIFTARPGDGTTDVVDRNKLITHDNMDVSEYDADELRRTAAG